jgi:glycine oxidase
MPDAVVIGAGVAGGACARALARRGVAVTVCDPGPLAGAASPTSAGMLAAQIEPDDALLALGVRGRDLYDPLAAELRDATGLDIGLWRAGILSVAFDEARAGDLQGEVARQRQAGLRCDWLEGDDVRREWPGVAPECLGALFSPEDGALDPDALRRALLADAGRHGATVRGERVTAIQHYGGRVTGVTTAAGSIAAQHVVLAAGAWSAGLAGLPRPIAVEPVRGQLAELPWPSEAPHAIAFDGHRYAVARGGAAIVGSTMERAGFDAAVTEDGLAQLRATTARLLPWLADRPFARSWAGLRPMTPDGRALVGPAPEVTGLWYATGHGRSGILLAAITGEIIADLVERGETDIDWSPLHPDREFGAAPA